MALSMLATVRYFLGSFLHDGGMFCPEVVGIQDQIVVVVIIVVVVVVFFVFIIIMSMLVR